MSLIDDRGRLFGKLNIFDAAVVLVICLLIPLTYGAYLLFRPQVPRLVAVEPERVVMGATRVNIRGEFLRPPLRLVVGDFGARFLVADSENGVMLLPPLQPGSYDVVLYDEAVEIDRLAGGLTVYTLAPVETIEAASAEVTAIGTFQADDLEKAQSLWKRLQDDIGAAQMWKWDVVALQSPEPGGAAVGSSGLPVPTGRFRVRAVLRFWCLLLGAACTVSGVPLQQGAVVPFHAGPDGDLEGFQIEDLAPSYLAAFANAELMAVGTFGAPDAAEAADLRRALQAAGQDAGRSWDVLEVQPPRLSLDARPPGVIAEGALPSGVPLSLHHYRMRAVMRFRCVSWLGRCRVLGVHLVPGRAVPVPFGPEGAAAGFWVEELRAAPGGAFR